MGVAMRSGENNVKEAKPEVRVIVAGAGPVGLLAAIKLLRRNDRPEGVKYVVELVDGGEDYGLLDDEALRGKRSWMVALSGHGLTALRTVPGLFEDYVCKAAKNMQGRTLYLGKSTLVNRKLGERFVADRNQLVAQLSRYLDEQYGSSPLFIKRYRSKINYVDADERRVMVGSSQCLEYDLLLGCDGVRSAVRAAFVANHRDFECSITDIGMRFKPIHVDLPSSLHAFHFHVCPQFLPGCSSMGVPSTGGSLNINVLNEIGRRVDAALESEDEQEVRAYVERNLVAHELPPDVFAKAWVAQEWVHTSQVHCSFYHSSKLQALLLGDAAHAASPMIGHGLNIGLEDAVEVDELLDAHGDDLTALLPAYNAARVKEGNALTALSRYASSPCRWQQRLLMASQLVRGALASAFPRWFTPHPLIAIHAGQKLSVAYREMSASGQLGAVRRVKDDCRLHHFERTVGLREPEPERPRASAVASWAASLSVCLGLVAVASACSRHVTGSRRLLGSAYS